jgi:hypothetical protein
MSHQHLSDDEIQDYLDGNYHKNNDAIRSHLHTCDICEYKLSLYKNIYSELNKNAEFVLSPQFPQEMASIVQKETPALSRINISDTVLSIVIFIIGISATLLLVDYKAVGKIFTSLYLPKFNFITLLFSTLRSIFVNTNMNLGLIVFALIILLCIYILDRLISHLRIRYSSS